MKSPENPDKKGNAPTGATCRGDVLFLFSTVFLLTFVICAYHIIGSSFFLKNYCYLCLLIALLVEAEGYFFVIAFLLVL